MYMPETLDIITFKKHPRQQSSQPVSPKYPLPSSKLLLNTGRFIHRLISEVTSSCCEHV